MVQPKEPARKRTLGLQRWLSLRQETPETVGALDSFQASDEDREPNADGESFLGGVNAKVDAEHDASEDRIDRGARLESVRSRAPG